MFTSWIYHWGKGLGRPSAVRLSRWRAAARRIMRRSDSYQSLADEELRRRGRELRWRAKAGEPLASMMEEAYALAREASRRVRKMAHHPVQIMGAIALFEGHVAQMQTGEGKTLTAVLPAFLRALPGEGCHVLTVNDYLAERDKELMGPIHEALGLSVGCIITDMETDDRRVAYACDITYGTSKEMGFDFLRDRLRVGATAATANPIPKRRFRTPAEGAELPVQRGHYFALVDEADSIFIDEARTPLIIGLTVPNDPATVNLLRWSQRATVHLESAVDYIYEPKHRSASLTEAGCRKVLLMNKPSLIDSVDSERIYKSVEQALTSRMAFERDRDYVVVDEKVVIVDEGTGRLMDGRKWQDGLHQAIEAKELIPITAMTGQAARVTVQAYFKEYTHLSGMTGTALNARRELSRIYRLKVTQIPTHRPCVRKGWPGRIFVSLAAKWNAAATEIVRLHQAGRAVLVGTPSVDASEALSKLLEKSGIAHQVLNARYHEQEAEIVGRAGQTGAVMIATNMAGRGTDILLDDAVRKAGGLHVIATEMHSSNRIDRQLIGRSARQGDPGTYQFFLSLEDELLRCHPPSVRKKHFAAAAPDEKGELPPRGIRLFERTQNLLERMHRKQRKQMLKFENHRLEQHERMGLDPYLELTEG